MRRPICLLLVPVMLAGSAHALRSQTGLRFDGIYQSQEEAWMQWGRDSVRTWTYLRFTPDGMVISFPTIGEPHQLGSFSLSNTMLPVASVAAREGRISFTVSDCGGALVDHEGRVEGDRLYLRVHSRTTGYRADRVFAFVPVPADRIRQWDGNTGRVPEPCGSFGTPSP
jgi:hypothetical protein